MTSRQVTVTPAQLPPEIPDFVGRTEELAYLSEILSTDAPGLRVVNVTGRPGIGKSTFAVCAAHAVRSRFPDGQVYVDLRDEAGGPVPLRDTLVRLLRSLGADEADVPASTGEATLMFRSWTAERKLLVLLDNAGPEVAAQHLLPGGSGCAVVITSQLPMGGLPGVSQLRLPRLSTDESVTLLSTVVGAGRVAREAPEAAKLATLADGLPLAVRAIAAKLASRPSWQLSRMVARLAEERGRLDELRYGGIDVFSRLAGAYQGLSARQRWVFRRLAEATGAPLTVGQLSELVSLRPVVTQNVLDELVDADLVDELETPDGQLRHQVPALFRLVGLSGRLASSW